MPLPAAISSKDYDIDGSPDGSNWTDYGNTLRTLVPSGRTRAVSETHTAGSDDAPVVTGGKLSATTITAEIVYTETNGDAFLALNTAMAAATAWYWRWTPKGATAGNIRYTTSAGIIQELPRPGMNMSNSADAVVVTAVTFHSSVSDAVVS